jgi:hypothetical protein
MSWFNSRDLVSSSGPVPLRESLVDDAETRLRAPPYPLLTTIRCEENEGVLRLTGTLPSYHLLQLALAAVSGIDGLNGIDNRVVVIPSGPRRDAIDPVAGSTPRFVQE